MTDQTKNGLPILLFTGQPDFEEWLKNHPNQEQGIWIKIAKKGAGAVSINYDQAVESGLCYGWIDSQGSALDESYYLQKFSPRRKRSKWSKVNREKAEALIASGRMQPPGLRQVELARQDGRWDEAYDSMTTITIPADFQQELDQNSQAREFFNGLNSQNRYAILHRLQITRKADARSAKIQRFIEMLAKNEKIYP